LKQLPNYYGVGAAEWDTPRWEDLRFPAQAINPVGLASPATPDVYGCLSFSGTVDNAIAGAAEVPRSWKVGSVLRPYLHLRFPTADAGKNTRWKFDFDLANPNAQFGAAYGAMFNLTTISVGNPNDVLLYVAETFGDLDMAGCEESCLIHWMITRLAASDAADTDTNACILLAFGIRYQATKMGTIAET
jgi:hypothetical protein